MSNNSILELVFTNASSFFSKKLGLDVNISHIDENAIKQWNTNWRNSPDREQRKKPNGGWDWAELRRRYYHKKLKYAPQRRIDIAIWNEEQLCGLVLGEAHKIADYIAIDYVEGAPVKNLLKGHILDIAIKSIEQYAILIRKSEIRLIDPVEGLFEYYKMMGFKYVGDATPHYFSSQVNEATLS